MLKYVESRFIVRYCSISDGVFIKFPYVLLIVTFLEFILLLANSISRLEFTLIYLLNTG